MAHSRIEIQDTRYEIRDSRLEIRDLISKLSNEIEDLKVCILATSNCFKLRTSIPALTHKSYLVVL